MDTVQANFSAKDVMALRQKTGLGMMDCKKALGACDGDMDAAEEWLRAKLKGKMDKRTERPAAEGRIGIVIDGSSAAIVELRTETDFTARNDQFVAAVGDIAKAALTLPAGPITGSEQIDKLVDTVRITTGENASFARGEKIEGGAFGSYVHHNGQKAALLQIEGHADNKVLTGVCMHIVAHVPPPIAIDENDVPAETIDRIKTEALQGAKESGKPDEIATKIAEGKVRKYLQQTTLLNQMYIKDPSGKTPVKSILPQGVTIKRFVRYVVGID